MLHLGVFLSEITVCLHLCWHNNWSQHLATLQVSFVDPVVILNLTLQSILMCAHRWNISIKVLCSYLKHQEEM